MAGKKPCPRCWSAPGFGCEHDQTAPGMHDTGRTYAITRAGQKHVVPVTVYCDGRCTTCDGTRQVDA